MFGLFSQANSNTPKVASDTAERFASLYQELMPKVFKYMTYKVGDIQTAEDLTSQVFEKALNKFKSHNSEKGSFATWVFSIARNTVIDHYRMTGNVIKFQLGVINSPPGETESPEDNLIRAEEFEALRSFISRLSQHEQEIISLKFGAKMSNRQIAKTTGMSESNVGTTVWRAVSKLRDDFREWGNG